LRQPHYCAAAASRRHHAHRLPGRRTATHFDRYRALAYRSTTCPDSWVSRPCSSTGRQLSSLGPRSANTRCVARPKFPLVC
jgi:hypothetical protein